MNDVIIQEEKNLKDDIRHDLNNEDMEKARKHIVAYLRRIFGDRAVDNWALRYYLQIGDESATIEIDSLIVEYLEKSCKSYYNRGNGRFGDMPFILTLQDTKTLTELYNKMKVKYPDLDKATFIKLIVSKFDTEECSDT